MNQSILKTNKILRDSSSIIRSNLADQTAMFTLYDVHNVYNKCLQQGITDEQTITNLIKIILNSSKIKV